MKISTKKILLIGGVNMIGKTMDSVFCFDLEKDYTIEQLDKIEKAGIVDYPVVLDQIGNLHLFLEKNNGTSPPEHVVYSFLEYSWIVVFLIVYVYVRFIYIYFDCDFYI